MAGHVDLASLRECVSISDEFENKMAISILVSNRMVKTKGIA